MTAPFQFDASVQTHQNASQGFGPVLGVQGGNSKSGVIAAYDSSGFSAGNNFMPEFFGKLLGPQIEAAKRNQFYQGVAAARAGKTVQEIKSKNNWFSNLFGETNYEAGATAWTASAATAEIANEMNANMDVLKTKTPQEMGQWLNEQSSKRMTGDVLADAVIQKSLLDQAGPLFETQAKANYLWKQEQLGTLQYDNSMSQARTFQSGMTLEWQLGQDHPDQQPDPMARAERERLLLEAFQPPAGQGYESYVGSLNRFVQGAAREGLWHSIGFLRQTEFYQKLPPEVREKMEKEVTTQQNRWQQRRESSDELVEAYQIRAMGAAGMMSPNELYSAMVAFNRKDQARTGMDVPYFSNAEIQSAVTGNAGLVYQSHQRQLDVAQRAREKAQDKEEKAMAEAYTDAMYAKQGAQGTLGVTALMPNYDKTRAEQVMFQLIEQNPTAGANALHMNFVNPKRWTSDTLRTQMIERSKAGAGIAYNAVVDQAYGVWQSMFYLNSGVDDGSGAAMAQHYFGEEAQRMFEFDKLVKGGMAKEDAYRLTWAPGGTGDMREGSLGRKGWEKDGWDALRVAAGKLDQGFFQKFTGGTNLSEAVVDQLAQRGSRVYSQLAAQKPHLTQAQLANQSIQTVLAAGTEVAGDKYLWDNMPDQRKVSDQLGIPNDVFGKVFDMAVTNRLRKAGLKVDSGSRFEIIRIGDDKDGPRMMIFGYDKTGTRVPTTLNAADFNEFRDAWAKENYKKPDSPEAVSEALNKIGRSSGRNY